ncbi:MAG: isoaspartyl peptidase/L-asparaginase [Planctomycetaceae bacterium]|nr:isoaspartyl peptidase/L-asparaginase [Planctomycetaceae bacterium]
MKVIASHNALNAAAKARELLLAGARPLDACVAGVTLVEDDPLEHSVGYGGIPNEDGIVELDAGVMDGKTRRGAGVAALRNVRHPSQVARLLLAQTHRVLLAGEGALQFARANGFVEENLLTDTARRIWLHWKRIRSNIDDWREPPAEDVEADVAAWFASYRSPHAPREGHISRSEMPTIGTVHVAALDDRGDLACCTSTSGHAFKIAGRVGDSPILGAGLFADNEAGTCGSLGHGEANLENLSSFAAVELMREGRSPEESGLAILRRIAARAHPEQKDAQGRPRFNLWLYLLAPDGRHAGVTLWGPKQFALADKQGVRLETCVALFPGPPPTQPENPDC